MMKKYFIKHKTLALTVCVNALALMVLVLWFKGIVSSYERPLSGFEVNIDAYTDIGDIIGADEVESIIRSGYKNDLAIESLGRVDLSIIEELIRKDSRVYDAHAFLNADRKLIIDIEQRRPIARVMSADGSSFYLDQYGVYVNVTKKRASRVPLITGNFEKFEPSDSAHTKPRLSMAYAIAHEIRNDEFNSSLIEQIHLDKNGRFILVPKLGSEKIVLAYTDELSIKLNNLKDFYYNLSKTNNWGKYDEIDISIANQVLGRGMTKDLP